MLLPSSLGTLIAFLLLVAPGLLADLLESRRKAGDKESSFREIGRVALFSLLYSMAGALIVGAVLALVRGATGFDALRAVRDSDYAADHFWWSVLAVSSVSLAGCAIAAAIHWKRFGSFSIKVDRASAWTAELGAVKGEPRNTVTTVMVELLTGERYVGNLAGYTPNLEQADRELTLGQPMKVRRVGDNELLPIPAKYERLVLRGDQIKTIAARKWVPPSAQDVEPPHRKLRVRLWDRIVSLRARIGLSQKQTPVLPPHQEPTVNRSFSAGAAFTLVIGLILLLAVSAQTISLGSFSLDLGTMGWILTVIGAVLLVLSLIPRRTRAETRRVDSAGRESVTEHESQI